VTLPLEYDSISWVCGSCDGKSFCGTTGLEGVAITFLDSAGTAIVMPYELYDWDGKSINIIP